MAADAELRGSARDVLLTLWGRDPIAALERTGDEAVVATFSAASKVE